MTQTPDERVMPWTLEQRIAQWREQAAQCRADIEAGRTISPYPIEGAQYLQGREFAFDRCADEAEAVLRFTRRRA